LGVAYVSIIIVWCFLTMFPFGGWMLVKRDFEVPEDPPDAEARGHGTGVRWLSKVKSLAKRRATSPRVSCTQVPELRISEDLSKGTPHNIKITEEPTRDHRRSTSSVRDLDMIRPVSRSSAHVTDTELEDLSLAATPSLSRHTTTIPTEPLWKRTSKYLLKFLLTLLSPPAISCLLSLTIALVPQLKALFVPVPGVDMPDAPDGEPPLYFILDITTFAGAASVPTGLIVLGASLSSLSLAHGLPPWGSIILMALLKLAVMPVIGVLWTQLLTYHSPLVNPDQTMLRFVMMLLAGGNNPPSDLAGFVRWGADGVSADCDDAGCFDSGVCSAWKGCDTT
jgi:auxin efflux carrier family protein